MLHIDIEFLEIYKIVGGRIKNWIGYIEALTGVLHLPHGIYSQYIIISIVFHFTE